MTDPGTVTTPTPTPTPRSPVTAAALSLLFPGLGEYSVGERRRAWIVAFPALVATTLLVGLAVGALAGGGRGAVLDLLLQPEALVTIVALDLVVLVYRLVAIGDAWLVARRAALAAGRRTGPLAVGGMVAVLVLAMAVHGAVAATVLETEQTLSAVFTAPETSPEDDWSIPEASFEPEDTPTPAPSPTPGPSPSGSAPASASPTPVPTPSPSPPPAWAKDGRLNLLLVGSDAGPGRWLLRTDTMVVLSVDVETGRAAMFGIPRNMVNVPLPDESRRAFSNGRYPRMINSLYVYALGHPGSFPGGKARGFRALTGAVQELVGVRLDGFVAVDLQGFSKLVNAFDGLWIRVPERIVDERYPRLDGSGTRRLVIEAGCQKLSGGMALAYARSRHQDSDYGRMRRQQAVLLALRRQLDPIAVLERAPELLKIARDHMWTTIKREDLAGLAELAARVDARKVKTIRFVPPEYAEYLSTTDIRQIRRTVRRVFEGKWTGTGSAAVGSGKACP
jgi:LCP family protein required for cell wall assembly